MDEIEYKLNTNNSVLIVNAIDKLISVIKSKVKPAERQKFVLENEELRFLREKCSSKQRLVSLTACQGLLALVELGVLEIAHTMSTVVTLLPSAHNYSAIISTMAGLLILDLRSRLVPGQPYRCQFGLRSPQHPFITVIEKNKDAEEEILTQMHALCTHPDYVVSSNSLELLRAVFLWLTSHPQRGTSLRPWRLLLSLPGTPAQADLLLACVSYQQINNPQLVERALAACSAVADAAVYQQQRHQVAALMPLLARISNELVKHGRDPRACYTAIERGFGTDAPELQPPPLALSLLADNLSHSSALHLHELFTLYHYKNNSGSYITLLSTLQWSSNSLDSSGRVPVADESPAARTSCGPWRLLLSLPGTPAQADLLLACVSYQQINNPQLVERAFAACSAVADAAVYQQQRHQVAALMPLLARISSELVKHGLYTSHCWGTGLLSEQEGLGHCSHAGPVRIGNFTRTIELLRRRDPRACYTAIERGFGTDAPELQPAAGLALSLLADNLSHSSALHLHELFTLCLNIISKYEYSTLCLSTFVALSLQWLHLPSHLTASALKTASKILDIQQNMKQDSRLYLPNLKANKVFQNLLYTDGRLSIVFKLNQTWERVRDDEEKFKKWMTSFESVDEVLKLELLPFFFGIIMDRRQEEWYKDIVLKALEIVVALVEFKKEVSVQLLPVLLYKLANDAAPCVKLECLKALPLMAKTKENVPTIVSIFNKLKTNKGVPTSFLIMLYASLAETQVRCFPYLQEILVEAGTNRPDDLKWEMDIARALAVKRICEIR
ncbi:hypothetical protein MSG28_008959 [Choristoneura fumiferana]|uniref:Uncharacterized protein n=1 Tax=Choristoneura fumiferana TaxID=7141 RepID=A0ACC0J8L8_CHOFU|nr:hypothetical protein MSG28_008959 [Choristoneura fumiferana]